MIAKTVYFCQVIIGLLSVVRGGVKVMDTQKRMAIKEMGAL